MGSNSLLGLTASRRGLLVNARALVWLVSYLSHFLTFLSLSLLTLFYICTHRYERDWKKIAKHINVNNDSDDRKEKTIIQIRSHAQKYFLKIEKLGNTSGVVIPPPRPKKKAQKPYPQKKKTTGHTYDVHVTHTPTHAHRDTRTQTHKHTHTAHRLRPGPKRCITISVIYLSPRDRSTLAVAHIYLIECSG